MPQISLDITSSVDRSPVYIGRLIDYGMLHAVAASITNGSALTGQTHIQVGSYSGTPDELHLISVLIDDYVYNGHIPAWTGRLPIEAGCGLFAIIRSSVQVTVRVAGVILKYEP